MKTSIVLSAEPDIVPLGLGGDFETNASLIHDLGFDGFELLAINLDNIDTKWIRKIAEQNKLTISAVGSGRYYGAHGLGLATADADQRAKTLDRVTQVILFASELDSNITIGAGQGAYEKNWEEGFNYLKNNLQICAQIAEQQHVMIYIEICNRYLPAMIRNMDQGIRLVNEVGSYSVRLLADTHHMNIEERSLPESIRQAKNYLAYMHFSDSNRLAPGQGHINYHEIADALREINFQGFAAAEFIPEPDALTATRQTIQLFRSLPY